MILTALCDLYDRLLADPGSGVAALDYSEATVVAAVELDRNGGLVRTVPLGTQKGRNLVGLKLQVPERVKRTSGDRANLLCDGADYLLGVDNDGNSDDRRVMSRHALSAELHSDILGRCDDEGARAVLRFFSQWSPKQYLAADQFEPVREVLSRGGNLVFRLQGDEGYVHDRAAVRRAWEAWKASAMGDATVGQCLVTGETGPIATLHKSIMGVAGANSTGASLVSFNFPAAESYGKSQGANSPVSSRAAFAYGTALNWLTSNPRHHVLIGDSTAVFWAERAGPEEDLMLDLFAEAMGAEAKETEEASLDSPRQAEGSHDEAASLALRDVLERVKRGQHIPKELTSFDERVRFFMLGLAPNVARLSVRFWQVNTFGALVENVRKHFEDMAIVHRDGERPVSAARLVLETAPAVSRKRDSAPKTLTGSLMRSVIDGTAYPRSLYATIICRLRSDANDPDQPRFERKVTYPRAAFIKAYLRRRARIAGDMSFEEALTEMLNTENKSPGYLLGRLFALLEKAQQDANPGINATIKDRYYASASATPGTVFPVLLRLAQHHLAKSEYGGRVDKQIEDVVADIDSFPAHLNLDQQGLFALGYYQQKAALYQKAQ